MKNKEAEELLLKYKAGTATAEEKALVEAWYARFRDRASAVPVDQLSADQAESWAMFEREYANSTKVTKLWPKIAVAAAAVVAVVFGLWFFNADRHSDTPPRNEFGAGSQDIAPGKNGATITLGNGKVIALSDAKSGVVVGGEDGLVYNDGEEVASSRIAPRNDGQLNPLSLREPVPTSREGTTKQPPVEITASTARGQTYQFTLPDGTKVWLNADSKLEFPSSFVNSSTRNVKLIGEGYFEVATSYTSLRGRRTKQPFIVDTGRQKIEVLGTHFNVTAYANDIEVKTTLLEGRVAVTEAGSRLTLDPGDQAYSGLDVVRALTLSNPEAEIAWKNGDLVFDKENLEQIMKKVARWYNIDVSYEPGVDKEQTFGGKVSRNRNISAVLKSMESTGKIKFKVEGKKVMVIK